MIAYDGMFKARASGHSRLPRGGLLMSYFLISTTEQTAQHLSSVMSFLTREKLSDENSGDMSSPGVREGGRGEGVGVGSLARLKQCHARDSMRCCFPFLFWFSILWKNKYPVISSILGQILSCHKTKLLGILSDENERILVLVFEDKWIVQNLNFKLWILFCH